MRCTGTTPTGGSRRRRVYRSAAWKATREAMRAKARFRCEQCGGAGRLEVHHVIPIEAGGAPFDERNLRVLCRGCHFRAEPGRDRVRDAWRQALDG